MYLKIFLSLVLVLPSFLIPRSINSENTLKVPSIGIDTKVIMSYSKSALKHGALFDMSYIEGNNWVIYGHRFNRFGRYVPFLNLDKIKIGDKIDLRVKGVLYSYIVVEMYEVSPDQLWVLSQGAVRTLTLVTCTPVYYPKNRLVIVSEIME